jgi:hypothetical protein
MRVGDTLDDDDGDTLGEDDLGRLMVMVGVAIVGVLSPPGMGHPGGGADAQPLRSGAGSRPSWGRPGRTAPVACAQPRRARRGRPRGRGPAAVGRLARRTSRPPARLAYGQRPTQGTRAGKGQLVLEHARRAHRSANGSSASSRSRCAGGWEATALLHTIGDHRACRPTTPHTPIQRGALQTPVGQADPSSSSTSRSAASPPASCTTHHHPRVPAT